MDQTDPWQVVPRQVFTPYYNSVCCSLWRWLSLGNQCVDASSSIFISQTQLGRCHQYRKKIGKGAPIIWVVMVIELM